jgi:hypothetical protein
MQRKYQLRWAQVGSPLYCCAAVATPASTQQHQQQGGLSETANEEAAHTSLIKVGCEASGRLQGALGIPWCSTPFGGLTGLLARQSSPHRFENTSACTAAKEPTTCPSLLLGWLLRAYEAISAEFEGALDCVVGNELGAQTSSWQLSHTCFILLSTITDMTERSCAGRVLMERQQPSMAGILEPNLPRHKADTSILTNNCPQYMNYSWESFRCCCSHSPLSLHTRHWRDPGVPLANTFTAQTSHRSCTTDSNEPVQTQSQPCLATLGLCLI